MDQPSHARDEHDEGTLLSRAERLLQEGNPAAALTMLTDGRPACLPRERPYADSLIGSALLGLGRHGEAYTTAQTALDNDPTLDGAERAHALLLDVLGKVHHANGHYQAATEAFRAALSYAERVHPPDLTLRARLLVNLGVAALKSGQVEPATIYYERAVEAARHAGEVRRLGMAHLGLGLARQQARDYAAALAHADEAMQLFEQAGEPRLAARARTNLAVAYAEQGAWDTAQPHLERVIAQARADGDIPTGAHALETLARAHAARGDYIGAADRAGEARVMAESVGDLLEAHLARLTQAVALVALGRAAEAEALYRQTIDYFSSVGASRHYMGASHDYANALRSWGRDDEALEVLDRAYAFTVGLQQG